jgi:hypothetical protein
VHLSFIHNGQSICRTSTNNGATWSPATPLPVSGEWGNSIIRTREGVLVISLDGVEDRERFGFRMPVSHTRDLGETWQYEAGEFPVVSSTQRPVLLRLKEGPILLCSFTDQARDLKKGLGGRGLTFRREGGEFTGVGLFAAVSYDEGQTWPDRRLHLLTSSKHYTFNLAWLKQLPVVPDRH